MATCGHRTVTGNTVDAYNAPECKQKTIEKKGGMEWLIMMQLW